LVTFKGPMIEKEIEESRDLMEKLLLSEKYKVRYKLPGNTITRYLLILKKDIIS